MLTPGEDEFRAMLDADGVLRPEVLAAPPLEAAYAVFAQRADATLDLPGLKAHAARFFDVKLGLTVDKRYGARPPLVDAARVVVSSAGASGTRLCFARPTGPGDLAAVAAADTGQGLAELARRCPTVWLVAVEPEGDEDDGVALTVAAVLASALLGPVLTPDGELLGARTARLRLG